MQRRKACEEGAVSDWRLPDWSNVPVPQDRIEWAEREAASDIQKEMSSGSDPGPLLEDVLQDFRPKVRERAVKYIENYKQEAVWKSRTQPPDSYAPPKTIDELKQRVESAETYFAECQLSWAVLTGFPREVRPNFDDAVFKNCNFERADFDRATFRRATFINCSGFDTTAIENADFEGAKFVGRTVFGGETRLKNASFERADLREVRGIEFDENFVSQTQFPADTSADAWSNLRRYYNGISLFFSGLLMSVFLIPFVVRLSAFVSYAGLVKSGKASWQEISSSMPVTMIAQLNDIIQTKGDAWLQCMTRACPEEAAFILALDVHSDQHLYSVAAIASALAFAFRYLITSSVASWREHEDRTHYTPAKSDYGWAMLLHQVLSIIRLPLIAFYAYVIYQYARTPVPVLS